MAHQFTCAMCHKEFTSDSDQDEAIAECIENFGVDPRKGDCSEVCDDCYQQMTSQYPPEQFKAEN